MSKHIPRIYISNLNPNIDNEIPMFHVEHLLKVFRMRHGSILYVFSEDMGEWEAELIVDGKQSKELYARCVKQVREPFSEPKICLAFGLIKPERLTYMLEKAVELGVTDLYPIVTDYTNRHSVKLDKISKHLIFATEQSERMSLPRVHNITKFREFLNQMDDDTSWYSAIERSDKQSINLDIEKNIGFIVGPEGGFSDDEKRLLYEKTKVICLSNNILRAETAAIACLAITRFLRVD